MKKNYITNPSFFLNNTEKKKSIYSLILLILLFLIPFKNYSQGGSCATAATITVNAAPITGGPISDVTINDPAPGACGGETLQSDGWYKFVAIGTTADISATSDARKLQILAYSGACGTLTNIGCGNTNIGPAGVQTETLNLTGLTVGFTYYIRIGDATNKKDMNLTAISVTTTVPCTTPNQATAYVKGVKTTTTLNGSFSAPAGGTTGYLIIQSTSATAPTHPANGTVYAAGNIGTLGAGLTFIANSTTPNFAATGLTGNTQYYYYIYAYNSSCSGGAPFYAVGVLSGNDITCPAVPNAVTTSGIAGTSFNLNWTAPTGGSAFSPLTYTIEIYTNAGYTALLTSYTATAPTVIQAVTGLANGTTYYYRIRANNACSSVWVNGNCTTTTPASGNDDCAGAINLAVNASCSYSTYTNASATNSAGVPAPGCANYLGKDVWFSAVVPANGILTVDTQTGVMIDSGLALYTGAACGSLTLLQCDDDSSANGNMSSITRTGLTPGTTIYIRVWEYGNDNNGTFGICVTSPAPCTTPAQATAFVPGTITSTAFPASFSGTASNFLVIQSTSATPPSQPVPGTVYTAANIGTLGAGLTFIQNGTIKTIAGTGLTGNTRYYYYIFAYNDSGCSGGPLYATGGPLSGNGTTCPAVPNTVSFTSTTNSVTLNWTAPTGGSAAAITYTIQVTTDAGYTANVPGSPFTVNAPGTTQLVSGLAANSVYYYRIRANNGCSSAWVTGTATTGYCIPAPTSVDGTGITNVTMPGINKNSGAEAGNYGNYFATDQTSNLQQGEPVPFSITFSTGFTYDTYIWVDWNNDLDFTDAGELVYTGTSLSASPTTLSGVFNIPGTAIIGAHRLRIGAMDIGVNNPCYTGSYAAFEDYKINVIAASGCVAPSAITANPTSMTATTVSWTAAASIPSGGYDYYYSTSATPAPVAGTAPNGNTAATTVNLTGLTSGTTYYVWVRSNCGGTKGFWQGPTSWLQPNCNVGNGTGTTTLGCPEVISGGLGLSGANPAAISCTSSGCVDLEASYLKLGDTSTYTVAPITYSPPYQYNCLKNPVSVNVDDKWSKVVDLPFNFCFYGNSYNKCLIGSNGVITFDIVGNSPEGYCGWSFNASSGTAANIPVAGHGALVENSIFGGFQDLDPAGSGEIGYELITLNTGCRALVASWSNVPMYSADATNKYTGMMVLYENTNVIEVYINRKRITSYTDFSGGIWNDGNAVVGIQNATGTAATVAPGKNGLDPNWTADNLAWRFTPAGASITSIKWYEGAGTSGAVVGTADNINVCPAATTTYTAEVTYTLCGGATLKEVDQTTVTVTGSKVWNGSVNNVWNNASNWTPVGVPLATDCVVIPDAVTTNNDAVVTGAAFNGVGQNLTVQTAGNLAINSTNSLTITDKVTVNAGGIFTINDSASLVQINNVTNTGNIQYKRTANNIKGSDYVYWSSPVASQDMGTIYDPVPAIVSGPKYVWSTTTANANTGLGTWTTTSGVMARAKGYIIRGSSNYGMAATNINATFTGVPHNGDITIKATRGNMQPANVGAGLTYNTTLHPTLNAWNDNWSLLGNPYPSAINALQFLSTNSANLAGNVRLWRHLNTPAAIASPFYQTFVYNYNSSDYLTINFTGPTTPGASDIIKSGQGFMVQRLEGAQDLTGIDVIFNNNMRRDGTTILNNGSFFRNSSPTGIEKHRIWLDIVDDTNLTSETTLIGYVEGATTAWDNNFDATIGLTSDIGIYSFTDNEKCIIQGRPTPFNVDDTVPLGINVHTNGSYHIAIKTVDGLFLDNNQTIYLEDKDLNIIHNLTQSPYAFTSNMGTVNNRFVLRYTDRALSNNENNYSNEVNVFANNHINIVSSTTKIKNIVVYDVLGKTLIDLKNVKQNEISINELRPTTNMVLVKVTLENDAVVVKKVIY